jgi:hypothetical protein
MRSASDESEPVLPWQVIRQDAHGNRYRVAGFATRSEAQHAAERLAAAAARNGDGPVVSPDRAEPYADSRDAARSGARPGTDGYLVESIESPDPPDGALAPRSADKSGTSA